MKIKAILYIIAIVIILCSAYQKLAVKNSDGMQNDTKNNFSVANRFSNGKKSFSLRYLPILNDLDLIDPKRYEYEDNIFELNVTFVSAWSHNHHEEAYTLITSLRDYKGIFQFEIVSSL